jgi:hypothetical protein
VIKHLKRLLRDEVDARGLKDATIRWFLPYCIAIFLGSSLYGATIGLWRAPLQSLFTAIKFPLLIFLTCIGSGVANGMLAQILGSGLSFKQTALAILMSFAVASLILGGFTPVTLFILYNTPPLGSEHAIIGHSVMLLTHVFMIAFAGVMGNRRLFGLLRKVNGHETTAQTVLFAWLASNLFLGAQLAWVLRPFIGTPHLAVEFLRPDPLRGNFYEAVWRALRHLLNN